MFVSVCASAPETACNKNGIFGVFLFRITGIQQFERCFVSESGIYVSVKQSIFEKHEKHRKQRQ